MLPAIPLLLQPVYHGTDLVVIHCFCQTLGTRVHARSSLLELHKIWRLRRCGCVRIEDRLQYGSEGRHRPLPLLSFVLFSTASAIFSMDRNPAFTVFTKSTVRSPHWFCASRLSPRSASSNNNAKAAAKGEADFAMPH